MLWAGGEAVGSNHFGGHWQRLTNSTIEVYRQPDGSRATEVRVRIWIPEYTIFLPLVTRVEALHVTLLGLGKGDIR